MKNNNGMLLTTEEFIKRVRKNHGARYDYSSTIYTGAKNKISIICKIHGRFIQRPDVHLRCGCKKCGTLKRRLSVEEFILRSKSFHRNKYDYSNVKYVSKNSKVIIGCPIHGKFEQLPSSHGNGSGCPKCSNNIQLNTQEFIKKAKEINGNRYDYSNSKYITAKDLITIICPTHGEFYQTPNNHISKRHGCRRCNCKTTVSKKETEFLNSVGIKKKYRQQRIGKYLVDAYVPKTKTVYEFLGDFWHGNPKIYKNEDANRVNKKSFGSLYEETLSKFSKLKTLGYTVKYIWENDWDNWEKTRIGEIPIIEYS